MSIADSLLPELDQEMAVTRRPSRVSATILQTVGSKGYDGLAFAVV